MGSYIPRLESSNAYQVKARCLVCILFPPSVSTTNELPFIHCQAAANHPIRVLVAAGARLYYLRQQQMQEDFLYYGAAASVCLEVELHYGLMAATIPCLKPFVKLFNTGWFDTRAMHSTSGGEQYALSNIQPAEITVTTEDKPARRKWNDRRHVRSQGSSAPSSAGSDIMIIRQTTAWDVTYDTNDQTV